MEATIVFAMRSLTTLPTRILRRLRGVVVIRAIVSLRRRPTGARPHGPSLALRRAFLLLQHGEQSRHLAARLPDLERIVELLHGVPESHLEQLLAQLAHPRVDLLRA